MAKESIRVSMMPRRIRICSIRRIKALTRKGVHSWNKSVGRAHGMFLVVREDLVEDLLISLQNKAASTGSNRSSKLTSRDRRREVWVRSLASWRIGIQANCKKTWDMQSSSEEPILSRIKSTCVFRTMMGMRFPPIWPIRELARPTYQIKVPMLDLKG